MEALPPSLLSTALTNIKIKVALNFVIIDVNENRKWIIVVSNLSYAGLTSLQRNY